MNEISDIGIKKDVGKGPEIGIVGGGLAGLVAAVTAAKAGASVTLYEGAKELGGRAQTSVHKGFYFNMGPHALYRAGAARRILKELGVEIAAAAPVLKGTTALFGNEKYLMPVNFLSIFRTRLFDLKDKLEVLKFFTVLPKLDARQYRGMTQGEFVDGTCKRPRPRKFVEAMCRLSTYTNAPTYLCAEVAINQLKLGMEGVLYLHGGWKSMVAALETTARECGVTIERGMKARTVSEKGIIEFANGANAKTDAVILCVGPSQAAKLCPSIVSLENVAQQSVGVKAACLDLAISELPQLKATFALGIDEPTYFSVHSTTAELAPEGGALIQAALYMGPDERAGEETRHKLESLVSQMQPGWRDHLVHAIYRPQAQVSHLLPHAGKEGMPARPAEHLCERLFMAGDWVGKEGHLSDAAVASAKNAAELAFSSIAPLRAGGLS